MIKTFIIRNEEEMLNLGRTLAQYLKPGDFIALIGDLGAGKSVLVRGAASHFEIEHLSSPTFTIVQEYPSYIPFFHFDAYRINDEDELLAIGFNDYLYREGIIFMEWANLVPGLLPEKRMDINIIGSGSEERTVCIKSYGEHYEEILRQL
jgi:tRNA threonylcarbamoyladenosine biosynthesis protein TsaE